MIRGKPPEKAAFDLWVRKALRQLIKIDFRKKSPLILVNGLAEQYESWFFNVAPLGNDFVVHAPNLYWYQSENFHRELGLISVPWIVKRLQSYLDDYIQTPPYHLVGSSSGCQTIVTYAARHPENVSKLVLICPSGLGGEENLPMIEGIARRDLMALISSIFYDKKDIVINEIVQILQERFDNKKWRMGFVRMAQVTKKNSILNDLMQIKRPVLFLCGEEDQIVPVWQAYHAVSLMRSAGLDVSMIIFPKCGHAPQIERAGLANKYIAEFLEGKPFHPNARILRHENGRLVPFDLDRAMSKFPELSQKAEHAVQHFAAA